MMATTAIENSLSSFFCWCFFFSLPVPLEVIARQAFAHGCCDVRKEREEKERKRERTRFLLLSREQQQR